MSGNVSNHVWVADSTNSRGGYWTRAQGDASGAAHIASIITDATSITPHDTNAAVYTRLWIGGAGDVAVRLSGMSSGSIIFKNVPIGFFPVSTTLVLATGTTATEILGLV